MSNKNQEAYWDEILNEYENGIKSTLFRYVQSCSKKGLVELLRHTFRTRSIDTFEHLLGTLDMYIKKEAQR
jgi:hypothetical protein